MAVECFIEVLPAFFDWTTPLACFVVMLNPLFWNIICRVEYNTHLISRTVGGSKRGVTLLALGILTFNCIRTGLVHNVVSKHNINCAPLDHPMFEAVGYLLIVLGTLFVITSAWKLGFYGIFMGDYFGILLDERVTGFPFNVFEDPMYVGSTMNYLGYSFIHASVIGLVLTSCVWISYTIALAFERPFTAKIYQARNKQMD